MQRNNLIVAALVCAGSMIVLSGESAAQDMTRGRNLAAACANCHGTDGRAVAGAQVLAGQDKAALVKAFKEFQSGTRPATIMHQISKGYTDQQIDLIAAYFAAQPKP
jgi:cytochrome c553